MAIDCYYIVIEKRTFEDRAEKDAFEDKQAKVLDALSKPKKESALTCGFSKDDSEVLFRGYFEEDNGSTTKCYGEDGLEKKSVLLRVLKAVAKIFE